VGGRVTVRTVFVDELNEVEEELRLALQNVRTARALELPRADLKTVLRSLQGHLMAAQPSIDRAARCLEHRDWAHSAKTIGTMRAPGSNTPEPLLRP
jgi:hypothetical protein